MSGHTTGVAGASGAGAAGAAGAGADGGASTDVLGSLGSLPFTGSNTVFLILAAFTLLMTGMAMLRLMPRFARDKA